MAHLTLIEDKDGQLVDTEVYCSDYCAKSSEHYAGWYGCAEISFLNLASHAVKTCRDWMSYEEKTIRFLLRSA